MSEFIFRNAATGVPLSPAIAVESGTRTRTLAAIALLLALGVLTIVSLIASGDEWAMARARHHAPPVTNFGPIDPNC